MSTTGEEARGRLDTLGRPTRGDDPQAALFDLEPDWRQEWWGMPSFEMLDARPRYKIALNFMTAEDVAAFAELTGLRVTTRSDSAWFPDQEPLKGEFEYRGPPTPSRYPICVPSKGRADCQTVSKWFDWLGVEYRFFVEETEADDYRARVGEDHIVEMPFHDLGQGSIPARNFIWDWARENGHRRHWCVDDNIKEFGRCHANRRLNVRGGGFFRAMEDFVDRYENVALAGPHDKAFVPDREPNLSPFLLNTRIYSCILIDTSLDLRWRGRYNEDTDLSLRVLKSGLCTVLFRALLMNKCATYVGDGDRPRGGAMKGGNTDNVYDGGDRRRAFAESLREQHPDVVKVVWRWERWHHLVDYSPFRRNRLIPREGLTPTRAINEYGMELVRLGEREIREEREARGQLVVPDMPPPRPRPTPSDGPTSGEQQSLFG